MSVSFIIALADVDMSQTAQSHTNLLPEWALGDFVRPSGVNPVIAPNPESRFYCPMRQELIGWEERPEQGLYDSNRIINPYTPIRRITNPAIEPILRQWLHAITTTSVIVSCEQSGNR
jgi:hypothetical protein